MQTEQFQFNFNGMPVNNNLNKNFNQAYELCKNYINCDGCPLIGYKPLQLQDGIIFCENGRQRTNEET